MKIADYTIKEKIIQGNRFTIYRATKENLPGSFVLKVWEKKAALSFKIKTDIQHEFLFINKVESPHVIKALQWFEDKDYILLVMEDIEGQSLSRYIHQDHLALDTFLALAAQITLGLAAIHGQNIIHKDINPSNIIWNPQTGQLKIIDFHIASFFDVRVSYLGNPERLQGTLPYISPEQTGRMNHRVDQRSDLYSLGVTFYEMITGQHPFRYSNPMEIVYAHLARDPEPPHLLNRDIPEIVSKIILKLLAKNPEERYQSADGLVHDLEKVTTLHHLNFPLGEKDFSGKLQIPEKLYGREQEVQLLLESYQATSQGAKKMILISGSAGSGKTALVTEIHKPITQNRGVFISGKFDQLQRSIPYSAFTQALNQFCQFILTENETIFSQWKTRILHAVGDLGKVLTDIIPQLEAVIGKQPNIAEVGGEEGKKRFNYVLQHFFQAISSPQHPLVLFLDDLQWADLASLHLFQLLMEDNQIKHLLFIGAYRDNEVSPSHPLFTTIEQLQTLQIHPLTIPVHNLSIQNLHHWLQDTLNMGQNSQHQDIQALTDLIYKKTQGNAFFTIQFLENLYKENLLSFNIKKFQWQYNIAAIEKKNITDNVVDLLTRKIQTLPPDTQEVLKLAACIGNDFELSTLAIIAQTPEAEHLENLETALAQHLVYPSGENRFRFIHDRIHQAAYALIAETDKQPLHLKIGRLLLQKFDLLNTQHVTPEAEHHLFDIVNHLNTGILLIQDPVEKLQLAQLNLKAGQNARLSAAYNLGAEYIRTAIGLLPMDSWHQQYDLTLALYNEAIQTSYLCGYYDEMETYVDPVLTHAREISQKTVPYEHRILCLLAKNLPRVAAEALLTIFASLGVPISKTPTQEETGAILVATHEMLQKADISSIIQLPEMTNPEKRLVLRLCYIGTGAFVFGAPELMPIVTCNMIQIILNNGLTPEASYSLCLYGLIRGFLGDVTSAYQFGDIVMELFAHRITNEAVKVRGILVIACYLIGNKEHYKKACKLLMDMFPYALNVGDLEYAGYLVANYISFSSRTDIELPLWKKRVQALSDQLILLKEPSFLASMAIEKAFNANLLDETANPALLDVDLDFYLKEMQEGGQILSRCMANCKRIYLGFLFDDYQHMLKYIRQFEEDWARVTTPIIYYKSDFYFLISLAYIQLYTRSQVLVDKRAYLHKVRENLIIMKNWAELGPVNFQHKYYLILAEYYRLTARWKSAAQNYDKAIEKAYENEYIHEAAMANELAGKYYIQKGHHKLAALYLMEARNCYHKWGALAKVKHLEDNFPKYLSSGLPGSTTGTGTVSSTGTGTGGDHLDIKTILTASQTLSGEVQLKSLLEKMMQIVIENAGAKKSILIEDEDRRLLIQAEGNTEGVSAVLQALPVEESGKVPLSVINYVAHSKQALVFDNISKDTHYSTDPYIQDNKPKSVVCLPILSKGRLSTILYLENNSVEGAFTPSRLEILNMLSSQIAISVENTHLYENLEEKVRQRTIALQEAHQNLAKNHEALETTHKKINDSVNYASRIQTAVLPTEETLAELLPQHFIFYRPCSVVSGDFYWVKQMDKKIVIAAADCTGHGVPGALVSMLGAAFLNEIVPQLAAQGQLTAANILDELRSKVKIALKQKGTLSEQKEGMDIALAIIDPTQHRLQYAGAYNPLHMIMNQKLTEIKADRMPIGIYHNERPFTNHDIPFQTGSMIYLFSDGYIDQNGENGSDTFTKKRFKQLLLDIHQETMAKQKEILIQRFEQWAGSLLQRDDILILGIRL